VLGRIGGEEFAVSLPDTSLENAVALGKRLGRDIAQQVLSFGGHRIAATVSSGVTVLDAADANADAALARADRALYEAKNAGRNAIRWRGNE
jgi:diguanylate cyclase (GGDEF)-like protein